MRAARRAALAAGCAAVAFGAAPLAAQGAGALAGTVRDATTERGIPGAVVTLVDGRRGAVTDTSGAFRVREIRSGTYQVQVRAIGYAPVSFAAVTVQSGGTTRLDVRLQPRATELGPVTVQAPDAVLDPMITQTEQLITAEDLRQLPVSNLDEAIALAPGAVGESYRGGRLGQQAFVIDGLGVKNQLDASTNTLGLRLPPDILTEASLVTNGFSARFGQALSGLVNVVTKDGGKRWTGRLAYESDRPFGGLGDLGLDRASLEADGPLIGNVTAVASLDANSRLDADPSGAPAPADPRDPRSAEPAVLPHNGGQQLSGAAKLTIPFGRQTLRLFGLRSVEDRLLYDQAFKYDSDLGPGRHLAGTLASVQLQHASGPMAKLPLVADLRFGYFDRDFVRGAPALQRDPFFGQFSSRPLHIVGEELARAQDTAAARSALPGFFRPELSSDTPWGVPAFFLSGSSRGDVAWNHFRELRGQLDLTIGTGTTGDLYVGGEVVRQTVRTFQRTLAYLPVGDSVPPTTASTFKPFAFAGYVEQQVRISDLAFTAGVRLDRFDARLDLPNESSRSHLQLNPRIGVSTVLTGATVVISGGSFSQAPDYQYLVDAAFDDTTRTGRFRRGNPSLGFERSWQWEMSVRGRPRAGVALRASAYLKRLDGLVASSPLGLNPDSALFANGDFGTVRGFELRAEREIRGGWGFRVFYTLQEAQATSTSAFVRRHAMFIDPITGDTVIPAKLEIPLDYDRRHVLTMILQGAVSDNGGPKLLGVRPFAGVEAAAIMRYGSGLPFTRLPSNGDTLHLTFNGARLPATSTVDVLLRRPFRLGTATAGLYLDVRNLFNRRNVVAVRRDNGVPAPSDAALTELANTALAAHPEAIPFESPRYRAWADGNGNGRIEGGELFPLYLAAATDFTQPVFSYGPPRTWRLGVELAF